MKVQRFWKDLDLANEVVNRLAPKNAAQMKADIRMTAENFNAASRQIRCRRATYGLKVRHTLRPYVGSAVSSYIYISQMVRRHFFSLPEEHKQR